MNVGYIKLFRSVREHWIYEDPAHFKAWFDILSEVNFSEKRTKIGTRFEICGRGQSLFSLESWARIFGKGWNKTSVRRFFKLLETDEMLTVENLEFRTTRITVVNYDEYQASVPVPKRQKATPEQPPAEEFKQTPTQEETIPIQKIKETATKKEVVLNQEFEKFYMSYDKDIDKKGTQKEYEKLTQEQKNLISLHLPKYILFNPNKRFRRNPKAYIKDEMFLTELIDYRPQTQNKGTTPELTKDHSKYNNGKATINLRGN